MIFRSFCRRARSILWAIGGGLLLVGLTGCGTQEYEQRLEASVHREDQKAALRKVLADQEAKFSGLETVATAIGPLPVKIRMPIVLRAMAPMTDPGTPNGDPAPEIMQPLFATQPGMTIVYESTAAPPTSPVPIPFECHLSVVPVRGTTIPSADPAAIANLMAASQNQDPNVPLADTLLAQLRKSFPEQNLNWEELQIDTPDLNTIPWKRITLKVDQPFGVIKQPAETLPGFWQMYVFDSPTYRVCFTWRVPEALTTVVPWEDLAYRMAGSLVLPTESSP